MTAILLMLPWQRYMVGAWVLAGLIFISNSYRLRKRFGKSPTVEEVTAAMPRAKIFIHWRRNKKDNKER